MILETLLLLTLTADPRAELEAMHREVAGLIAQPDASATQLEQTATRHLDVAEAARRACGEHWARLSRAQRREITRAFAGLLRATWANRPLAAGAAEVELGETKRSGDEAEVAVRFVDDRGRTTSAVVRLHRDRTRWRIFDVEVLGRSLLEPYARSFQKVLAGESPEALVKKLREKTGEVERGLRL